MAQYIQRPGKLDILIERGDDVRFTIKSSIDLSGYTLAAKSGSTTLSISATEGMPAGYYYDITITKAQTAVLASGSVWELSWDDTATKHRKAAKGRIAFDE